MSTTPDNFSLTPEQLEDFLEQLRETKRDSDPVMRASTVTAISAAIMAAAAKWGFNIEQEAVDLILVLAIFAVPIFSGLWARRRAWSPNSVASLVKEIGGNLEGVQNPSRIQD